MSGKQRQPKSEASGSGNGMFCKLRGIPIIAARPVESSTESRIIESGRKPILPWPASVPIIRRLSRSSSAQSRGAGLGVAVGMGVHSGSPEIDGVGVTIGTGGVVSSGDPFGFAARNWGMPPKASDRTWRPWESATAIWPWMPTVVARTMTTMTGPIHASRPETQFLGRNEPPATTYASTMAQR